ncbi:hypothetical protein PMAYCL1PPCAC_23567, partial [Pristionchus mayeri]
PLSSPSSPVHVIDYLWTMCMKKKTKPKVAPVKAASARATATQPKVDISKKTPSAPAKGPDQPIASPSESNQDCSAIEKTCISEKSDHMQISAYKPKKKDGGSGSGPIVTKPADRDQDSPEVFENNAQVQSLNPINVTQIFMDSVIPQTNVSKVHSDIVDQNTLETVDPNVEDIIFDDLESGEENNPEEPQPRPKANVLQPEDDTIAENTISERRPRQSERRIRTSRARAESRPPTTPDRLPSVFTPQLPTKSEKVFATCKRAPSRGALPPLSTRTTTVSRPRPVVDFQSGRQMTPSAEHIDNTCPSHEPLVTQRTLRPKQPLTDYRTVVQTAVPIELKDDTCQSREPCDSTATAKKTPAGRHNSNIYTAHENMNGS